MDYKKLGWLSLIDLVWYFLNVAIFFTIFYAPMVDILEQAYKAINENTLALTQASDPTNLQQIAIWPYAQSLIIYILVFIGIAAVLGLAAEYVKVKVLYKKPFWGKTAPIQIGQLAVFLVVLSVSHYLFFVQLAFPILSLSLIGTLVGILWIIFFWLAAHSKARLYGNKKFRISTIWQPAAAIAVVVFLVSFQSIDLIITAGIAWIIFWNWYQLSIATFK